MRRLAIAVAIVATFADQASATGRSFGTKATKALELAVSDKSLFGLPAYTTAALPPCTALLAKAAPMAYDTTDALAKVCNGTSWGSLSGGVTSGVTPLTGFVDKDILYNASGVVKGFQLYDDTGAGNGAFALRKTMSGSSTTSNFFSVTGTMPTSPSAITTGVLESITAATSGQLLYGHQTTITAASASFSNGTAAGGFHNSIISTAGNGDPLQSATFVDSQAGIYASSTGADQKGHIGIRGYASGGGGSATHWGVVGFANGSGGPNPLNIGGLFAANGTATAAIGVAGILGTASPTWGVVAAGLFDNGTIAGNILAARDNAAAFPTTGATATWRIADGAVPQAGLGVLTSATMTAESQAQQLGGLIHSYTWTNAMVTALGAVTTGDITVATLPAKTRLLNAYVVIVTPDTSANALTVSCGDAVGGTPFINYVVASDAKAAANTVYGDAVAERGTSIDVEWYYLPSYTGTTLVTCHFIKTTTFLNSVVGSTGRVILETSLIP